MKKLTFLLACMFALLATPMKADNEKAITVAELPKTSQEFIKTHYAGVPVMLAKVESGFFESKEYKVIMRGGEEVEFYATGEWKQVDGRHRSVPAAIVPDFIAKHVAANWPEAQILKIEKDKRNKEYEVELSNRLELTFSFDGVLTDIDD